VITLDSTNKTLEFKLGGAVTTNQLPSVISYVDLSATASIGGEQDTASNGTNVVTILTAPAASTQRIVRWVNIRNRDTVAATVTVQYNNNATVRELLVITLQVNDSLQYLDADGWSVITGTGEKKSVISTGKSIKTVSGSLTADTDVIAAVTGKRLKITAYSLISVGTNANTILFKSNGTAGTEQWRVLLQSSTAIAAGANLAVAPPAFIFATVAGEKLTMDVNQTDAVHYSITYFDDDAV
jgi:hypothetical protein